eukprot:10593789-Prorocentrum_lima.AAC.1
MTSSLVGSEMCIRDSPLGGCLFPLIWFIMPNPRLDSMVRRSGSTPPFNMRFNNPLLFIRVLWWWTFAYRLGLCVSSLNMPPLRRPLILSTLIV